MLTNYIFVNAKLQYERITTADRSNVKPHYGYTHVMFLFSQFALSEDSRSKPTVLRYICGEMSAFVLKNLLK